MTYPCAFCGAPASADTGCPACGRGPDPDAIEVVRIDAEIGELIGQLATARRAVQDLEERIGQAWQRRHTAAARVRAAVSTPAPAGRPRPEASGKLVQNVLFLLGGLLLAVAAIVFTAVAWAQFGVAGRAAVLACVTLAALAVPPLVLRRRLTATAETAAAVGLLLVLLDGYAAWYVNLLGVAAGSPLRYAGAVCAVTAALAAGYARLTGLTAPRWAAALAAQPALPLLVAPLHPGPAGWTLAFGTLAAANFACRTHIFGALATLVALAPAAAAATQTLETAAPVFHAPWHAAVPPAGWRLPAALALAAAALTATVSPRWRTGAALAGAAAVALALPAGLHLPWWHAPTLDLLVVAAALTMATRIAPPPAAASRAASASTAVTPAATAMTAVSPAYLIALAIAAFLGLHAVAVGSGRPAVEAGVLAALAVFGFGTASLARRPALGDAGLFLGMLVMPAIAWTATVAFGLSGTVQCRTVAAAAGLLAAGLRLMTARRPVAAAATLLAILPLPLWALAAGEPVSIYAALGLLFLSLTGPRLLLFAAALVPVLLFAVGPALVRLLTPAVPIWAGRPAVTPQVAVADAVAVLIAAAAAGLVRRWAAVPVLGVAVPLLLASASVPWPVLPFAELALGIAALLTAALRRVPVAIPAVGGALVAAGVGGALPTRASTLVALGAVLLAAAVAGAVGRASPARAAGWLTAVAAGCGVAVTAGSALELDLRVMAFLVLAVAVSAFALSWWLASTATVPPATASPATASPATVPPATVPPATVPPAAMPLATASAARVPPAVAPTGMASAGPVQPAGGLLREDRAVEAAAHAAAVLALLLTTGYFGYAAAVCALWGAVLGVRALRAAGRSGYLIAAAGAEAAGWLLLMAAAEIAVLEAYTVMVGVFALVVGMVMRRRRMSSWVAYGPALAATLLPSLASVLVADGQYLRRLLLGLGALMIVVAGATFRLRAPVVIGGGVLAVAALRELAGVWDLIPRWIPLAAGGLLLVVLASTLERRRRDLARFRQALGRMT